MLAPSTPVAGNTSHAIPSSSTSSTFPSTTGGAPSRPKKHLLSSTSDALYAELRDKNFAFVGQTLNRVAKRISGDYERRNEAKTPREIREFVGRLGGLQSEHQALRLRASMHRATLKSGADLGQRVDTGLSEQIMSVTQGDEFNNALEIQQSARPPRSDSS